MVLKEVMKSLPHLSENKSFRPGLSPGAPRRDGGLPSSKPGLVPGTRDLVPNSRLKADKEKNVSLRIFLRIPSDEDPCAWQRRTQEAILR